MASVFLRFIFLFSCFFCVGTQAEAVPKGINWWKGSVEQVFAKAKKDNRPMFLYWGAVWCPPCNQIKKTVFSSQKFKEAIKEFVPVYLDGDQERAQIWGDKLQAKGYPTMLVLSPSGSEIMRLPMGRSVDGYIDLLKKSQDQVKPMKELVGLGLEGKLDATGWSILAGFSWGQDHGQNIPDDQFHQTFERLFLKIPTNFKAERALIFLQMLDSKIDHYKKEKKTFNESELKQYRAEYRKILEDEKLFSEARAFFLWYPRTMVNGLYPEESADREKLVKDILKRTDKMIDNSYYSLDEQLSAYGPQLYLNNLGYDKNPKYSAELKKKIRNSISKIKPQIKDDYTRQAVMSTAIWLLSETGQFKLAKELGQEQLKKSTSPFYFMSYLASVEKKEGNNLAALNWRKKAWKSAKGFSTRLQWGRIYISNLVDLAPQSDIEIKATSLELLKEIGSRKDAFHGRNLRSLNRLSKQLKEWGKDKKHAKTLAEIKSSLDQQCQKTLPQNRGKCQEWVGTF